MKAEMEKGQRKKSRTSPTFDERLKSNEDRHRKHWNDFFKKYETKGEDPEEESIFLYEVGLVDFGRKKSANKPEGIGASPFERSHDSYVQHWIDTNLELFHMKPDGLECEDLDVEGHGVAVEYVGTSDDEGEEEGIRDEMVKGNGSSGHRREPGLPAGGAETSRKTVEGEGDDVVSRPQETSEKGAGGGGRPGAIRRQYLDRYNVDYFRGLGMEWKPDVNALLRVLEGPVGGPVETIARDAPGKMNGASVSPDVLTHGRVQVPGDPIGSASNVPSERVGPRKCTEVPSESERRSEENARKKTSEPGVNIVASTPAHKDGTTLTGLNFADGISPISGGPRLSPISPVVALDTTAGERYPEKRGRRSTVPTARVPSVVRPRPVEPETEGKIGVVWGNDGSPVAPNRVPDRLGEGSAGAKRKPDYVVSPLFSRLFPGVLPKVGRSAVGKPKSGKKPSTKEGTLGNAAHSERVRKPNVGGPLPPGAMVPPPRKTDPVTKEAIGNVPIHTDAMVTSQRVENFVFLPSDDNTSPRLVGPNRSPRAHVPAIARAAKQVIAGPQVRSVDTFDDQSVDLDDIQSVDCYVEKEATRNVPIHTDAVGTSQRVEKLMMSSDDNTSPWLVGLNRSPMQARGIGKQVITGLQIGTVDTLDDQSVDDYDIQSVDCYIEKEVTRNVPIHTDAVGTSQRVEKLIILSSDDNTSPRLIGLTRSPMQARGIGKQVIAGPQVRRFDTFDDQNVDDYDIQSVDCYFEKEATRNVPIHIDAVGTSQRVEKLIMSSDDNTSPRLIGPNRSPMQARGIGKQVIAGPQVRSVNTFDDQNIDDYDIQSVDCYFEKEATRNVQIHTDAVGTSQRVEKLIMSSDDNTSPRLIGPNRSPMQARGIGKQVIAGPQVRSVDTLDVQNIDLDDIRIVGGSDEKEANSHRAVSPRDRGSLFMVACSSESSSHSDLFPGDGRRKGRRPSIRRDKRSSRPLSPTMRAVPIVGDNSDAARTNAFPKTRRNASGGDDESSDSDGGGVDAARETSAVDLSGRAGAAKRNVSASGGNTAGSRNAPNVRRAKYRRKQTASKEGDECSGDARAEKPALCRSSVRFEDERPETSDDGNSKERRRVEYVSAVGRREQAKSETRFSVVRERSVEHVRDESLVAESSDDKTYVRNGDAARVGRSEVGNRSNGSLPRSGTKRKSGPHSRQIASFESGNGDYLFASSSDDGTGDDRKASALGKRNLKRVVSTAREATAIQDEGNRKTGGETPSKRFKRCVNVATDVSVSEKGSKESGPKSGRASLRKTAPITYVVASSASEDESDFIFVVKSTTGKSERRKHEGNRPDGRRDRSRLVEVGGESRRGGPGAVERGRPGGGASAVVRTSEDGSSDAENEVFERRRSQAGRQVGDKTSAEFFAGNNTPSPSRRFDRSGGGDSLRDDIRPVNRVLDFRVVSDTDSESGWW